MHSQIEKDLGFKVEKIESDERLEACLLCGMTELYQEAFSAPPYCERFSADDVKAAFREYLQRGGHIFVAIKSEKEPVPVGFVVAVPLKSDFDVASAVGNKIDVETAGYFADAAVSKGQRRQGVSSQLKRLILEHASISGMKVMVSRTSQYNYKQISAFNKAGATILSDLYQDIESKRIDGSLYLAKDQAKPWAHPSRGPA